MAPAIVPRTRPQDVPRDRDVLVELRPQRIPAREWFRQAVHRVLALRRERVEPAIPHNQYAGVVAILIFRIHAMMHPVMRRRVEDPLGPRRHAPDRARVNPKLIDEIERVTDGELLECHAEHGERDVEDPREHAADGRLTQRHREVVFLAGVMHDVTRPEQVHLMRHPMKPVVGGVHGAEGHDP